jgi:hypothetical protein
MDDNNAKEKKISVYSRESRKESLSTRLKRPRKEFNGRKGQRNT